MADKKETPDLFQTLLAQAKAHQAKTAKSKSKTGKTYSESKKSRTTRTKNNILHVKERINGQHDRLVISSLRKELIEVLIHKNTCKSCGSVQRHVENIRVWSKATRGEHLDPWRMTQEIHSLGALQCNSDLPVRKLERNRYVPACPDCIDKMQEKLPWKG